ncbi:MAG: HRDC domain-containing protein, partial [Luteimonas sp.]|nr:HRDC domain-containing protein [Luteimonas sp.]
GRAGRDGTPADAWMAYGLGDVVQQRRMIEQSEGSEEFRRVSLVKLDALLGLCETAGCRRVRLLDYFGETGTPCGNCDNCLSPPQTWDATEAARKALSCIYRTGQRFGAVHLIDVLRGADTERIRQFGHDRLGVHGVGADLDARTWRGVFRQLVAGGLLDVDAEGHGGLRLTQASRAVLKGEQSVMLRRVAPRRERTARSRAANAVAALSTADQPVFEALRALRTRLAREQNVPPYVIFHDSTLREIAARRPAGEDELATIAGVGSGKLARYGALVLDTVAAAG